MYVDFCKWCIYYTQVVLVVNYNDGGLGFNKQCQFKGRQFCRITKMCFIIFYPCSPVPQKKWLFPKMAQ